MSAPELDSIVRLTVGKSISDSVGKLLEVSSVDRFCYFCDKNSAFSESRAFASCESHITFQLLRFSESNGTFVKNSMNMLSVKNV